MSLVGRYLHVAGDQTRITCPDYERLPEETRCRHYLQGGACARPDELMCVEWVKANEHLQNRACLGVRPSLSRPRPLPFPLLAIATRYLGRSSPCGPGKAG